MKDISEVFQKMEESKVDFGENSNQEDCIYPEEMVEKIQDQGNVELVELRQTTTTIQCPSCWKHIPDGKKTKLSPSKREEIIDRFRLLCHNGEASFRQEDYKGWSTTLANIAQASHRRTEGNHQEWKQARNWVDDDSRKME